MNVLPFRRTVARSYAFAVRHFLLLVRVGWLWFLLAYAGGILAPMLAAKAGWQPLAHLGEIVMVIAGTAVVVAWHRTIATKDAAAARRSAVFGRRELRYLGIGIGMLVVLYIPVVAMAALMHLEAEDVAKVLITVLAAVFLVIAVSINRLILVFPAIALGLGKITLKRSWTLTAGNTWRLFLGVIVCSGPPLIIAAGLTAAADIVLGRGTAWWVGRPLEFLSAVALFVQLAVVGGFLSFVFEHFVGPRTPAPVADSPPRGPETDLAPEAETARVA